MENWREKEKESGDLEPKRKWTIGGGRKKNEGELEGKREKVKNWRGGKSGELEGETREGETTRNKMLLGDVLLLK